MALGQSHSSRLSCDPKRLECNPNSPSASDAFGDDVAQLLLPMTAHLGFICPIKAQQCAGVQSGIHISDRGLGLCVY